MVVMDPLDTESASSGKTTAMPTMWNTAAIRNRSVPPAHALFAEKRLDCEFFTLVAMAPPPAPTAPSAAHSGDFGPIAHALKEMYEKRVARPSSLPSCTGAMKIPTAPRRKKWREQSNGYALADIKDADGNIVPKGELLDGLPNCATTAAPNAPLDFFRPWTQQGNQMDRRLQHRQRLGNTPESAWAWPANRRILTTARATPAASRGSQPRADSLGR